MELKALGKKAHLIQESSMKGIAGTVSRDAVESFRPSMVKVHYPMPNF